MPFQLGLPMPSKTGTYPRGSLWSWKAICQVLPWDWILLISIQVLKILVNSLKGQTCFSFLFLPLTTPNFLLCFCFFCCVGFGFFSFSWGGKAPKGVLPSICKLLGRISKVLSAHCIPSAVKLYCFHSNQWCYQHKIDFTLGTSRCRNCCVVSVTQDKVSSCAIPHPVPLL